MIGVAKVHASLYPSGAALRVRLSTAPAHQGSGVASVITSVPATSATPWPETAGSSAVARVEKTS